MANGGGQNSSQALTLISGARYFFLVGKRVRTCRVAVDVLLAVGVIFVPASSYWLALASLAWLVVSRLGLSQWEERSRQRGAFTQWEFERCALKLTNVTVLCCGPSNEDVYASSKRMLDLLSRRAGRRIRFGVPAEAAADPLVVFRDWFPTDPLSGIGALDAQRASAEYTRSMAQRWVAICGFTAASILGLITLMAAIRELTVPLFLVTLFLPCTPILVALGEELVANVASNQLRSAVIASASMASSFSPTGVESALASNAIIALIWRIRAHGVPDFIYWIMRRAAEERMRGTG